MLLMRRVVFWQRPARLLVIALIGLVVVLALDFSGLLLRFERNLLDQEMRLLQWPDATDIGIISVDKKSLEAYGAWPWSRRIHARLIERLADADSGPVAFDLLFATAHATDPAGDVLFAEAMKKHGHVVLAMVREQNAAAEDVEVLPMRLFASAATAIGHTDFTSQPGQPLRAVYLMAGVDAARWPVLALAVMVASGRYRIMHLPGESAQSEVDSAHSRWVRAHRVMVPFVQASGHFPMLSFADVAEGRVAKAELQGKSWFVGVGYEGIRHLFTVPFCEARQLNGMEINASVLNALEQHLLVAELSGGWRLLWLGGIFCLSMLVALLLRRFGYLPALFSVVLLPLGLSLALLFAVRLAAPVLPLVAGVLVVLLLLNITSSRKQV